MRLGIPGVPFDEEAPTEIVGFPLPAGGWASAVLGDLARFKSVVVGPGLGRAPHTIAAVQDLVASAELPLVLDGDGLFAVARGLDTVRGRARPTVLTPHDGEYEGLTGHSPVADRLDAARSLAADTGAVVLLKGSTTVVADVDGHVLVTSQGDARLATAGTGDVLAGAIGAFLARGVPPARAAAAGAFVHGRAGTLGWSDGLVAGDLPDLIPAVLNQLQSPRSFDADRRS